MSEMSQSRLLKGDGKGGRATQKDAIPSRKIKEPTDQCITRRERREAESADSLDAKGHLIEMKRCRVIDRERGKDIEK